MIIDSDKGAQDGISRTLDWVWRWKFTVLTPVACSVLLAIVMYGFVPAQYSSQAVLVMDIRNRQVLPGESLISPLPQENPVVKTEIDIISSRTIAAHALTLLQAAGVEVAAPVGAVNPFIRMVGAFRDSIGAPGAAASAVGDPPGAARPPARAEIDALLKGLRVSNDGSSYTIFIEYVSTDPDFAAAAANAFASAYLEKQVAIYNDAAARAQEFLGPRVESLRVQLEETERKRQARRQAAGLDAEGEETLPGRRLADLSTELAAVRAAIAEARARLETARNASPDAGSGVDSPQIRTLAAEKSRLTRARESLVEQGALRSQALAGIEQDLDAVDAQIADEFRRVLGRLAQEVVVQERKKAILEAEIGRMRAAQEQNVDAMIAVAQLDREVEASSAIYESFLSRYKESIEQQGLAIPDARLISAAEPGVGTGGGRLAKWLIASLVIGVGIGGGGAFGRSALEARRASPEGVLAGTDAAIFGFAPRLPAATLRGIGTAALDTEAPWGAAFTAILMNALSPRGGNPFTVIAVTSARAGDGRTMTAIGLAQATIASGGRALLVDCDLRDPQIAARAGLSEDARRGAPAPGAAPPGAGNMRRTSWGCDVLTLAASGGPGAFALGTLRLRELIAAAGENHDLVILDGPAMEDQPTATQVAAAADLAIHVVRWPRSLMSETRFALEDLAEAVPSGRVGVVFSRLEQGGRRLRAPRREHVHAAEDQAHAI